MKLVFDRESLLQPLQTVIGVVERKQTMQILSNVLLKLDGNKLSVTGTDSEIELIADSELSTPVTKPYELTLPGRKLIDICKALPDNAPIELYQESNQFMLRSGRSRFTLSTLPAEEFPNIQHNDSHVSFTLPQSNLLYLLGRTYFSIAQQDVRYYLNGMLLEVASGKLRTIATDGHRLAFNMADADVNAEHKLQFIVPRKGVLELMRLLVDNDNEITISLSSNHIRVTGQSYTFTSKLIDGRFPDYERAIPKHGDKIITLDRDEFKQALNRSAILCNEKFRVVRFEFRKNLLRITANNPEQEVAEEELQISYESDDFDIGFNVNYLIDILNILEPGPIKLTLADSNSSMLIQELHNDGNSLFVAMPMRL